MVKTKPFALLSGNQLKLLAAALMLIDHIGVIFFPQNLLWRLVGRLSMPIFAFFIAEGCRYTRSPLGYLGKLFACLLVCQAGNYLGTGSRDICILGTFFLGACLLFCLQYAKAALLRRDVEKAFLWGAFFAAGTGITYYVNQLTYIDYGFWGCMLPVFAGLFYLPEGLSGQRRGWDNKWTGLLSFCLGLALLVYFDDFPQVQVYCLLALPLLALYSEKRGVWRMKYFFYLFYPLHLAALQGIFMLVDMYG